VVRTGHQVPAQNLAVVWMTATFGHVISAHLQTPSLPKPARLVTANIDSANQSSSSWFHSTIILWCFPWYNTELKLISGHNDEELVRK
jgi:hypothetical protein